MAKSKNNKKTKGVTKNMAQFIRTAENLARKGKTNKKLRGKNRNVNAIDYNIA